MNKNVMALKKVESNNTVYENIGFIILVLIPSIINGFISIFYTDMSSINIINYLADEYVLYVRTLLSTAVFIAIIISKNLTKYKELFYLPISSIEYVNFIIYQNRLKLISSVVISIIVFIGVEWKIGLNNSIIVLSLFTLLITTLLFFYLASIILTLIMMCVPSRYFDKAIYIVLIPFIGLNWIPTRYLDQASVLAQRFINSKIFSISIDWIAIICIGIALILGIFILNDVRSKLLIRFFNKRILAEQAKKNIGRNKALYKLKIRTPFRAYLINELILIKRGYFKLCMNFIQSFACYGMMILVCIISLLMLLKSDYEFISMIVLLIFSITIDIPLFIYNLKSIAYVDSFIECIKATNLNPTILYMAKFSVKVVINSILYFTLTTILYICCRFLHIQCDFMIKQIYLFYFNIIIMTYLNNNLDFRYDIFENQDDIKTKILKGKKYGIFSLGKLMVLAIPLLINEFIFKNIYLTMLVTYIVIVIILWMGKETITIHIPSKRAKESILLWLKAKKTIHKR